MGRGTASPAPLRCMKCGIRFRDKKALAVHLAHFCVDTEFGDKKRVKKIVSELQINDKRSIESKSSLTSERNATTLADIRKFLAEKGELSKDSLIGAKTIEEARKSSTKDPQMFQQLKEEVEFEQRKNFGVKLKSMKENQAKIIQEREKRTAALKYQISMLQEKRRKQLQRRVEQRRIQEKLRQLDGDSLSILCEEKRKKAESLAIEKTKLVEQQQKLRQDIQELTKKILRNKEGLIASREGGDVTSDKIVQRNRNRNEFFDGGRAAALMYRKGAATAKSEMERTKLEEENAKLSKELEKRGVKMEDGGGKNDTSIEANVTGKSGLEQELNLEDMEKALAEQDRQHQKDLLILNRQISALEGKTGETIEKEEEAEQPAGNFASTMKHMAKDLSTDSSKATMLRGLSRHLKENSYLETDPKTAAASKVAGAQPLTIKVTGEDESAKQRPRKSRVLGRRRQRRRTEFDGRRSSSTSSNNNNGEQVDDEARKWGGGRTRNKYDQDKDFQAAAGEEGAVERNSPLGNLLEEIEELRHEILKRPSSDPARESLIETLSELEREAQVVKDMEEAKKRRYGGHRWRNSSYSPRHQERYSNPPRQHQQSGQRVNENYGEARPPPQGDTATRLVKEMKEMVEKAENETERMKERMQSEMRQHQQQMQMMMMMGAMGGGGMIPMNKNMEGGGINPMAGSQQVQMDPLYTQMARLPEGSKLYNLYQDHLVEKTKLRFEHEILSEQREIEAAQRQWEKEQAREIKEAKRREREEELRLINLERAREILEDKIADRGNNKIEASDYDPRLGCFVQYDYVLGLRSQGPFNALVMWQLVDNGKLVGKAERIQKPVVEQVSTDDPLAADAQTQMFKATINKKVDLGSLAVNPQSRLLVQVQIFNEKTRKTTTVGWSSLHLFNSDKSLNTGWWRVPLHRPPLRLDATSALLGVTAVVPLCSIYLRLLPTQDMNQQALQMKASENSAFYQPYRPYARPRNWTPTRPRQSNRSSSRAAAPPKPVQENKEGENNSDDDSDTTVTTADDENEKKEAESDKKDSADEEEREEDQAGKKAEEQSFGLLVTSMEWNALEDPQYSRLQIEVWRPKNDANFNYDIKNWKEAIPRWTLPYAQRGISGALNTTRWLRRHVFGKISPGKNVFLLVKAFLRSDRPLEDDKDKTKQKGHERKHSNNTSGKPDSSFGKSSSGSKEKLMGWTMLRLFFPTNELEEQSDDEDNFEDNNGDDEDDSKSRPSEWGLARITSPVSLHPPPIDFETGIKECLKSASSPDEEGKDEGREENRRGSFFDLGKLLGNQVGALDLSIYNPKLPPPEEAEEVPLMEEKTKGGSNLPWILHVHQSKDITFESGDGLNVYVDAARFLPENVFLSRVSAVVIREGGSVIVPYVGEGKSHSKATDWAGCSLSGSRLSPTFNLRVEYREDRFDPTAFLLIILACVDRKGTYHHVGVSTINLFYSSESKNRFESPPDPNIGEYCLNEGAFQLPIRYAWPEEDEKFVIEAYEKLERIPCATVLMRIEKAKKSPTGYGLASVFSSRLRPSQKDALITPAPNYGSKTYDSTRCKPDKNEQLCYGNIPKKLSKTKIRDTARALSRFYKFEDKMGDDDEKDNGSKKNERYFQKFVKKSLVKESGRLHSDFPMINPYRMRRFIAEVGFSVSIDGLENLNIRNSELAIVIYSLSPPSPFYNEDPTLRIAEDVEFTTKWDMSSVTNKPRFETGWFRFKEVEHSNELLLVIDVRALDTRKSNSLDGASADEETCEACLRPLGWGVLPIFDRDAQS